MRRTSRRARRPAGAPPSRGGVTLTSRLDILTCLLFFVLKSFVAGGEVTAPPPGVDLPKSTAEHAQTASLVVAIDRGSILVGSERIVSVQDAEASPQMLIAPLAERLKAARKQMDDIRRRQGADSTGARIATIQGDEAIEFRVLEKVMYTLNQAGFEDIALAVIKRS
ncbi:MAG TPA: biopolymer transporter ExbD [Candidatus Eisenbacteria bacterium]